MSLIPNNFLEWRSASVVINFHFINLYVQSFITSLMPTQPFLMPLAPLGAACMLLIPPQPETPKTRQVLGEQQLHLSVADVFDRHSSLQLKILGARFIKMSKQMR